MRRRGCGMTLPARMSSVFPVVGEGVDAVEYYLRYVPAILISTNAWLASVANQRSKTNQPRPWLLWAIVFLLYL
jgi:hypothetical protein